MASTDSEEQPDIQGPDLQEESAKDESETKPLEDQIVEAINSVWMRREAGEDFGSADVLQHSNARPLCRIVLSDSDCDLMGDRNTSDCQEGEDVEEASSVYDSCTGSSCRLSQSDSARQNQELKGSEVADEKLCTNNSCNCSSCKKMQKDSVNLNQGLEYGGEVADETCSTYHSCTFSRSCKEVQKNGASQKQTLKNCESFHTQSYDSVAERRSVCNSCICSSCRVMQNNTVSWNQCKCGLSMDSCSCCANDSLTRTDNVACLQVKEENDNFGPDEEHASFEFNRGEEVFSSRGSSNVSLGNAFKYESGSSKFCSLDLSLNERDSDVGHKGQKVPRIQLVRCDDPLNDNLKQKNKARSSSSSEQKYKPGHCGMLPGVSSKKYKKKTLSECSRGFQSRTTPGDLQTKWSCPECKMTFTYEADLIYHSDILGICCLCNKNFTSMCQIKKHSVKGAHIGLGRIGKPSFVYSCTVCGEMFDLYHKLKTHRFEHGNLPPYSCSKCYRQFKHWYNLHYHHRRCKAILNQPKRTWKPRLHQPKLTCEPSSHQPKLTCEPSSHQTELTCNPSLSRAKLTGKPILPCSSCSRRFTTKVGLRNHVRMHTRLCESLSHTMHFKSQVLPPNHEGSQTQASAKEDEADIFFCKHCSLHFRVKSSLDAHCRLVHSDSGIKMNGSCNFQDASLQHLKTEGESSSESVIVKVMPSSENSRKQKYLIAHDYNAGSCVHLDATKTKASTQDITDPFTAASFVCSVCSARFNSSGCLNIHSNMVHSRPKSYMTGRGLFKHKKRFHAEGESFICNVCLKVFGSKYGLNNHKRVHTTLRSLDCNFCSQSFESFDRLRAHKQTAHLGTKLFVCHFCAGTFRTSDSLDIHKRSVHGESRRSFCCHTCSKSFKDRSGLRKHKMLVHLHATSFVCAICTKAFPNEKTLLCHRTSVHVQKSFICSICSKAFKSSSVLNNHKKQVHFSQRPFCCHHCLACFKRKDHLQRHLKVHPEEGC